MTSHFTTSTPPNFSIVCGCEKNLTYSVSRDCFIMLDWCPNCSYFKMRWGNRKQLLIGQQFGQWRLVFNQSSISGYRRKWWTQTKITSSILVFLFLNAENSPVADYGNEDNEEQLPIYNAESYSIKHGRSCLTAYSNVLPEQESSLIAGDDVPNSAVARSSLVSCATQPVDRDPKMLFNAD